MVLRLAFTATFFHKTLLGYSKQERGRGLGGTYGTYEGEEQRVSLIFVQKCGRNSPDRRGRMECIQLTESTVQ